MGWVWKDDGDDDSRRSGDGFGFHGDFSRSGDGYSFHGDSRRSGDGYGFDISVDSDNSSMSSDGDVFRCATRKLVKTQCRTEESEPGKFIRKCEKTEQIFKDCVGRPSEMVQSNKEYTEEDVTNEMTKVPPLESSHQVPSNFPGLRNDIEAMERNFFSGIDRFFEAAEETMNGFFGSFGIPRIYDGDKSSSSARSHHRGIPVEINPSKESSSAEVSTSNGDFDFSGMAKDV